MDYVTLMLIVLGGPLDGYVSTIPYPSEEACGAAIEIVEATLTGTQIEMVQCKPTGVPSGSIRPLPRPEGLGNG